MIRCVFTLTLGLLCLFLAPSQLLAQDSKAMNYPELEVVPKASERLKMEAQRESGSYDFGTHVPIQVSALSTLIAGIQGMDAYEPNATLNERDSNAGASTLAMGVGALWLGATVYLSAGYQPYTQGLKSIQTLPEGTARERLIRERLAEEALERPARLGRTLQWMSFVTNLGAGVYLAENVKSEIKPYAYAAAALSVAPLIFRYRWNHVFSTHERYKKRIYGPVAYATLIPNRVTGDVTPGLGFSMSF